MTEEVKGDTPTHRLSILEIDDQTIETILEAIRVRRLKAVRDYEEAKALKDAAAREGLEEKLQKALDKFMKRLEKLDDFIESVEEQATKLRAMKLELDS